MSTILQPRRTWILCILLAMSPLSHAYTNQWAWQVQGFYRLNEQGQPVLLQPGSSAVFSTKQEALATMRSLAQQYYQGAMPFTQERTFWMSQETIQYAYGAPSTELIITPWLYNLTFSNEADMDAAIVSAAQTPGNGPCTGPGATVTFGAWLAVPPPPPWGATTEAKSVTIENAGCINLGAALRTRQISCPSGWYGPFGSAPPYCSNPDFPIVSSHPVECPLSLTSTFVGNPCDVATGDKSQVEVDYSGDRLRFARSYHSTILDSTAMVGIGWTHNYAPHLAIYGGVPVGVLRPSGHHDVLQWMTDRYVSLSGAGLQVVQSGAQWIAHLGNGQREIYDAQGRLVEFYDRPGSRLTLTYNSSGELTTVADAHGHALQFTYENRRLSQLLDAAGQVIAYTYDAAGNLSRVDYQDGRSRIYHYENPTFPNFLTGITDESGVRYATYAYDSAGRAQSSEHAGGADRITIAYNGANTVVTDARGGVSTFTFTNNATLSRRVTGLTRNTLNETYVVPPSTTDVQRRSTQKTDARGVVTRYTYDRDHLTLKTEALGTARARSTSYQYGSTLDDLPSQINEPNRRWTFTYNSDRNLLSRTLTDIATGQIRTWTYTYDTSGRMLTENGPRTDVSDITTYTYYNCSTGFQCGQVQTVTNALGHVTTFNTYDAHGEPLTITDPNGLVTTFTYDARQRLTSYDVGGELTTLTYYPTGLARRVTLPDASYLELSYDDAHRLAQIRDGAGNRIVYTLDGMSNRTREEAFDPSNALSHTRSRVYDVFNRLAQEIGAANQTSVNTYDDNSNLDTVTDPRNRVTSYDYDELNRLIRVTDPALGLTEFGYDANDNLISVTDPRTLTTSYTFNGFGDLTQLTNPDTGVTQHTPDAAGNLDSMIDARNRSADYSYDALNRPSQVVYSDQTVAFEYDQGTNARGRLTRVTDASGNTQWTYNAQGRVASKLQTTGALARMVSYGYNSAGQLTQITTPSGQTIGYGYTNNQVTSVTVNGATLLNQVLYEPFGPTRGWAWANGTFTVRDYDTDWQLTLLDSAGLSTFTRFPDGLIQTRTDDSPVTFGVPAGTTNYTPATTSNRLASSTGTQARAYVYDAAGNTTSYTGATFTYNDAGRMNSATTGGVTTSYLLNGLGQRVRKSNGSLTRLFVYDESGHLLGEYDQTGALIQETVWLEDIPVATLRPSGASIAMFYVHADHLNTPRKITRPSDNTVLWRWESDPFGQAQPNEDTDGDGVAFVYNLRFPGQYFDAETGLTYNKFRDYDASTGRYSKADPIGLVAGTNLFIYADGNPIALIDALGLICEPGELLPLERIVKAIDDRTPIDSFRLPGLGAPRDVSPGADIHPPSRRLPRGGIGPGLDVEFDIVWMIFVKYRYQAGVFETTIVRQEFICTDEPACPGDPPIVRKEVRTEFLFREDIAVWTAWEYVRNEATGYRIPIPVPGGRVR